MSRKVSNYILLSLLLPLHHLLCFINEFIENGGPILYRMASKHLNLEPIYQSFLYSTWFHIVIHANLYRFNIFTSSS